MAELAASILAPTADSAIKNLGAVIKRQFIYLCCFSGNMSGLETEAVRLDNAIEGLQARVDAATNNVEGINPEVSFWLSDSDNLKEKTTRILNEAWNVELGCLTVAARFTLSKRAAKTTIAMAQQRQNCIFSNVSLPPPIAASRVIPLGTTSAYEFESRKKIEESIMMALMDKKENNMIGICGMGGLGKTTMAKRIMNRALEEKVFEEVVMAVVSRPVNESKIQLEIGGSLGLNLKDETFQARLQKLHERLSGKKKILLVLDDVWTSLNLNDLGIPCDDGSNGCTILITSRNSDALTAMDVRDVFGMKHLSEEDAWFLFKNKAGSCVDESKLSSTAKKVAKECNGLPIALATVGAALKDEKDVRVWNNALKQLRKPNPNNTPDFIAQVYNPVIVSCDMLNSEKVRSLLLLCCLFPEDSDISIELLSMFCFGLRLFEDIESFEEARDTTWTSIKSLKDRSLLLDSEERECVRMHDSVRDVCVFISTKKGYIGGNDCRWLFSSGENIEISTPNLHLLSLESVVEIDDNFFKGVRDLKVLSIQRCPWTSLPQTTQMLKNLRTLRLDFCKEMETISIVGELVNLEIFICNYCYKVKELPTEMKRLNRLKLLDLSDCSGLQSIGRGIISSLVRLEELKMMRSFNKWEGDDGEKENAGLRELESLTNLRCLEIEIADPALAAQNMRISSKLERFNIGIPSTYFSLDTDSNKSLVLSWKEDTCLGDWIEMQLLRDTECLYLVGEGTYKLDSQKLQNLRRLRMEGYESVNNIALMLPLIEYLHIFSLKKQEEIWDAPISLLTNLSCIQIRHCPRLLNVGQLLIAGLSDCLPHLEKLEISYCEMMEQVFLCSQRKNISAAPDCHNSKLLFPKLKELELHSLPNLTTFCQGIEGFAFPLLHKITFHRCPKLRSIISTTSLNRNERGVNNGEIDYHHGTASEQNMAAGMVVAVRNGSADEVESMVDRHAQGLAARVCGQVTFGSLKVLESDQNPFWGYKIHVSSLNLLEDITIRRYDGSMSLFTPSIAGNLFNLKHLEVAYCYGMSKVIEDGEEEDKVVNLLLLSVFPKLERLLLTNLPELVCFWEWKGDVEWPSLREVFIWSCPNMKKFTLGPLTTPNLTRVSIDVEDYFDATNDLNGMLQQYSTIQLQETQQVEEDFVSEIS